MNTNESLAIGFIGLGVMGEAMCRNLIKKSAKSGDRVTVFDLNPAPVERLVGDGAKKASSPAAIAETCDIVFLSLPGGEQVQSVLLASDGILANARNGLVIIDLSTSPVTLTRELAAQARQRGLEYIDAPVARTRAAAVEGTLAIMAGGSTPVFERVQPYLACMASDIIHCGDVGNGQLVKIMNNMVLFQTVVGLAEALTLARRAGLEGEVLFKAMQQGSAGSFALDNHGTKALLPGEFPLQAFSTRYAEKDLHYALQLAEETATATPGADTVKALFERTIKAGFGDEYWPSILKVIDPAVQQTEEKA